MCLKMDGALRKALVDGGIPPHYLEYMSPDKEETPHIFTRGIIRRPGRWGIQPPYAHSWASTKRLRLAENAPCPQPFLFLVMIYDTQLHASLHYDRARYANPRLRSIG